MRDIDKYFNKSYKLEAETTEQFTVSDGDKGIIEGYAAVWGEVPFTFGPPGGVYLEKGAFAKSINDRNQSGKPFPIYFNHNPEKIIGKALQLKEDERGLWMRAQLAIEEDDFNLEAKRAFSQAKKGYLNDQSVGFSTVKREFDEEEQSLSIKEGRLMEISLVARGAIPTTSIDRAFKDEALLDNEPELEATRDNVEPLEDEPQQYDAVLMGKLLAKTRKLTRAINERRKKDS